MRKAKFKIENFGKEIFEGFTKEENWNGWDCPYFTFEQAQLILKTTNQLRAIIGQDPAYYNQFNDAFVFPLGNEEFEIYTSVLEENQKYYPIGSFNWIWEEV